MAETGASFAVYKLKLAILQCLLSGQTSAEIINLLSQQSVPLLAVIRPR